jgi:hypothetical protein
MPTAPSALPGISRVFACPIFCCQKDFALTIANGSSLWDFASKFFKPCWVPLWGMVTWGKL